MPWRWRLDSSARDCAGRCDFTCGAAGKSRGRCCPTRRTKIGCRFGCSRDASRSRFRRRRSSRSIPKASPLDDYFEKAKKAPQTVQSQYDLGSWCEQNKLSDLAKLHYETALAIDKSFEPAHKKLGHIFHDGYWLSRDDLSAVQGLVKYKGTVDLHRRKGQEQAEEEASASQASWIRRIKILRAGDRQRARRSPAGGESQLMAIREADAVGPLLRVLGNDEPPQRILLAQVLAGIPGKEATVGAGEADPGRTRCEVRPVIFEKLKDRDDPARGFPVGPSASSADIQVINRAAWTLGNLEPSRSCPS